MIPLEMPLSPSSASAVFDFRMVVRDLFLHPRQLLPVVLTGFPTKAVMLSVLLFWLGAGMLFAITALLNVPADWHLTTGQLAARLVVAFLVMFFAVPLFVFMGSVLQKVSAWFWDMPVTYLQMASLAGLSVGYYAGALLLALPVLVVPGLPGLVVEILLFALNLAAFILTTRLFVLAYQAAGSVSRRKAIGMTLFPLGLILFVVIATQVLTYFASYHTAKPL